MAARAHDLQAVKAAGVTFAVSMIERVIEERARGDLNAASDLRDLIAAKIGGDLRGVIPGSERAAELKQFFIDEGLWSQYLEVGIGPDAEIFTKAMPLSALGTGEQIGVLSTSTWNNPEPEVALVLSSAGTVVGATLANDVNLRDIEGRSALLLPKAKDNNASCATGPFIRLFDEGFGIDDVRTMAGRQRRRPRGRWVRDACRIGHAPDQPRPSTSLGSSSDATTSTRMGPCSCSAPCSPRSTIATSPAWGSRIRLMTSS
ncbi:hypothetical protein [Agromyces flavus]|uniref:hypothetical protein n=1 Tax=Agromyces flavus TaxID=589382 RepID=UPI00360B1A3C